MVEDEQRRMWAEDLAAQVRDRAEEERLRLEEEEVDWERERKTKHAGGRIQARSDTATSNQSHKKRRE